MIDWMPDPIALSIGPFTVYWYGIMYAIGLAATYVVVEREARRRGLDTGSSSRHHPDRGGGPHRRPPLPRHRPVGPLQGRPPGDRPAALQRPRGLRGDRDRLRGRGPLRPLEAPAGPDLGRRGRPRNPDDAGDRPLGHLLQPALRAAHEPPWGIALGCPRREWACPPAGATRRTPFHPLFLYDPAACGRALRLLARARGAPPGDMCCSSRWYGTTRFPLEPLRTTTGPSSGSRPPRSSARPS